MSIQKHSNVEADIGDLVSGVRHDILWPLHNQENIDSIKRNICIVHFVVTLIKLNLIIMKSPPFLG